MESEQLINVALIYNAFDTSDIVKDELVYQDGKTLDHYLEGLPDTCEWRIGLNGVPIEPVAYREIAPKANDLITVVAVPRGSSGKDILRMVAMVALVAAATYFLGPAGAGLTGTLFATAVAATVAIGGFLINLAIPPASPKIKDSVTQDDGRSYGYDGAKNTAKEGVALPVIYGQFQVAGNYVDVFAEDVGDDQYIYGRCVLSDGEIDSINGTPEINEQPIDNYKDVEWGYTLGTPTESVNPKFVGSKAPYAQDVKLNTTYTQYSTTGNVDSFELDFVFPQGMCVIDTKTGNKTPKSVAIEIQYSTYGTNNWSNPGTRGSVTDGFNQFTGASPVGTIFRIVHGADDTLGLTGFVTYTLQYRLAGAGTWTDYNVYESASDSFAIDYGLTNEDSYRNVVSGGRTYASQHPTVTTDIVLPSGSYEFQVTTGGSITYKLVRPAAASPSSGGVGGSTIVTYSDSRTKTIRKQYKSPPLPRGRYDIRYRRVAAESGVSTDISEVHCTGVTEVQASNVALRNIATGWYCVKMTDQLSGLPNITWPVKGVKVDIYDINGNVTANQWSDNPADIVLDMLVGEKRGPLRGKINIDYPAFVQWRTYCATEGLKFNGVFDDTQTLWDALSQVFRVGRAMPVRAGTKVSVAVDKPTNPVMLFGPGNIYKDTFNVTYLGLQERANEYEVSYYDKDDRNKRKTIRIADPQAAQSGQIPKTVQYDLFGVDNFTQAQKEVWYQLYNNRLSRRIVSFDAPVESIGLTLGDVALIQHDMMDWASSGRLASASSAYDVVLDKPVAIENGKTYSLLCIHDKISRFTCNMSLVSGTTYSLTGMSASGFSLDTAKRLVTNTGAEAAILDYTETSGTTATVTLSKAVAGTTATVWDVDVIEERSVPFNPAPPELIANSDFSINSSSELVTNGTFTTNTTGWTASAATLTVASSRLRVTSSGAANGWGYQAITCIVGQTYQLTADLFAGTGTASINVGTAAGTTTNGGQITGTGTKTLTWVATATTYYVSCVVTAAASGIYSEFDNVSVLKTSPDNWTASSATLYIIGGNLRITNNSAAQGQAYQAITTEVNKTYTVVVAGIKGTANLQVRIGTTTTGNQNMFAQAVTTDATPTNTATFKFTATATTTYIQLRVATTVLNNYVDVDTVSVKLDSAQLIINGYFNTNVANWTAGSSTLSNVGNDKLRVTNSTANTGNASQQITGLTPGAKYNLTLDFIQGTSYACSIYLWDSVNQFGTPAAITMYASGSVNLTTTLPAGATSVAVYLINSSNVAGEYSDFDNIRVTEVKNDATTGTTNIHVQTPFSATPNAYSNYMFGEQTFVKKPYRLRSISGDGYERRTLTFGEYNSYIYSAPETTIPAPAIKTIQYPSHVSSLALAIEPVRTGTGDMMSGTLTWSANSILNYSGADIYTSLNGADYVFLSTVWNTSSLAVTLPNGSFAAYKVVAFNNKGYRANVNTAPVISGTYYNAAGTLVAPTALTWTTDKIASLATGTVSWTAPNSALGRVSNITRVQIQLSGTLTWLDKGTTDQTKLVINNLPAGSHTVRIRSENAQGELSDWVVATATVSVPTLVAPTILADGTAVDHALNADGSADISLEWQWTGTESDIDGFEIVTYSSSSSSTYTIGTTPAAENITIVPASKRAIFFQGVAANQYYTFYVRAYKDVDSSFNSSGRLRSTSVKPTLAAENPYRPTNQVAFTGSIVGTLNTTDINNWAAISGTGKPADNADVTSTMGSIGDANRVRFSPPTTERGTEGYTLLYNPSGLAGTTGISSFGGRTYYYGNYSWTAANQTFQISTTYLSSTTASYPDPNARNRIPVTPNERIFVGARIAYDPGATGGTWFLLVNFYDTSGNGVGTTATVASGANDPGSVRQGGFVTVPTTAVSCVVLAQASNNTSGATYATLYMTEVQVCSAGSLQTIFPAFSPGPLNAPLDSFTSIVINGSSAVNLNADSSGTVYSGQLPKTVQYTASAGNNDYTTNTNGAWSITVPSGVTATIGAHTGTVSITAFTVSTATVTVSFSYSGVVRNFQLTINRKDDSATSGGTGSGGTVVNTSTLGDSTGSTYDTTNGNTTSKSAVITVKTGSAGQIAFSAPLNFLMKNGAGSATVNAYGKWQYCLTGTNAWSDAATETVSSIASTYDSSLQQANDGVLTVSPTKTGLNTNTNYDCRFLWRDDGTRRVTRSGGTLQATGS